MPTMVTRVWKQLRDFFERLQGPQRWLVIGMAAALPLAIGLGVWLNQPEWVPIANLSQMDPKDAAEVDTRLAELKVQRKLSPDGNSILVPQSDYYTARLALAQAGQPKGTSAGWEAFTNPSFGATDFTQRVNLQRAREGDLERALTRLTGVQSAKVSLGIPERTVYTRDQKPTTAAVMIEVKPGHKMTRENILAVVNFVSSGVSGLTPENVTVVDQNSRLLSAGLIFPGDKGLGTGGESELLKEQAEQERQVEAKIQTALESMFGVGNVQARVHLELNLQTSKTESQTIGQSVPKSTTTERESSTTTGTSTTAQPATTDPTAVPNYQGRPPASTGDQYASKTKTDYETSKTTTVTVSPWGSTKRVTVGVFINRPDLTADQVKVVKETVAAASGAVVGDISVAALPFNNQLPDALKPAASTDPKTIVLAAGLGTALFVLILGFYTNRRRNEQEELAPVLVGASTGQTLDVLLGSPPGLAAASAGQELTPGLAAGVPVGQAGTQPPPPADQKADTSADEAHARQVVEFVRAARPKRKVMIDDNPVDEEMMSRVTDLIDSSPEACAELVRQWLRGERAV